MELIKDVKRRCGIACGAHHIRLVLLRYVLEKTLPPRIQGGTAHKELINMARIDGEDSLNSQAFQRHGQWPHNVVFPFVSEHRGACTIVDASSTYLMPLVGRPLLQSL